MIAALSVECVPSERDLEVHRLVTVDELSTREAAELMRISQTRVCQVVRRVNDFLRGLEPAEKDAGRRRQQVQVAEAIAVERLGGLYRRAVDCFELSHARPDAKPSSRGDIRFLNVAARIALQLARLPANDLLLRAQCLAAEQVETAEQEPAVQARPEAKCSPPAKEDCSACAAEQAVPGVNRSVTGAVNASTAEGCELASEADSLAKLIATTPVQPPRTEAFEAAAGPRLPLSKKQRRARERQLRRAR